MKSFMLKLFCFMLIVSTTLFIGTACKNEDGSNEDNSTHVCEYTKTVIPPTCDTQGYTLNECSCGKNYKESFVYALGHVSTPAVKENEVLATCITGGSYDSVVYCNTCGKEYSRIKINTSKLGHSFVNYVSNNDATVEADGTKTAKCERVGCNESDTVTDVGSKLVPISLTFKTLTAVDNTATGRVSSATSKFNFNNEIAVSENCNYLVSLNNNAASLVLNKEVDLVFGNNVFYVFLMNGYNVEKTYTVSIYRLSSFKVSFNSKISGVTIPTQTIEEGDLAVKPEIAEKDGYDLLYDFDFNTPITKNETVTVEYKAIFYSSEGSIYGLTEYGKTLNSISIPEKIDGFSIRSIGYNIFLNTEMYNNESNWDNGALYIDNWLIEVKTSITGVYTIKDGTVGIAHNAFYNCDNLISVIICDSVVRISDFAFNDASNLTNITLGNSVESIGDGAFNFCEKLASIKIPKSVKSIGNGAFLSTAIYENENNWDNGVLYIDGWLIKAKNTISGAYTIKEGTVGIAGCSFNDCGNLISITIPNSVISISFHAFSSSYKLTSITYNDTKSKWNSISKGSYWNLTVPATYVTCTNGNVTI